MKSLKQTMDDLDRTLQHYNDLNDQVLVIEDENEFGDKYNYAKCLNNGFDWRSNYVLPGK